MRKLSKPHPSYGEPTNSQLLTKAFFLCGNPTVFPHILTSSLAVMHMASVCVCFVILEKSLRCQIPQERSPRRFSSKLLLR